MDKIKISLYEEMYYWLFFYISKITKKLKLNPPLGIKSTAFQCFQVLKLFNTFGFWFIIGNFFIKNENYLKGILSFIFTFWVMLFILDFFLLFPQRDYIITFCEKFSKKRQTTGKIKFWIYITLTIIIWIVSFPGKG